MLDFALALLAKRLRAPSQLIRLATASSRNAADVAAAPYAITVSMVLDRLDDRRSLLRVALKNNRVLVARDILAEIYDIEYALRVGIHRLDASDWGKRLDTMMEAITALVATETKRFPGNVRHVLGSSSLRRHRSLAGRLTHLAVRGRDAMTGVRNKLLGQPEKAAS